MLFRNPVHPYTQALLAAVPTPDPSHRLDFNRLMEDKASDPRAWPEPFRRDPENPPHLIEIAPGHCVEPRAVGRFQRPGAGRRDAGPEHEFEAAAGDR